MTEHRAGDRRFLLQWIGVTWAGWVLGVPCIVLLALIGEAIGLGGMQTFVGAGMGTGVGLLQGRVLRGLIGRAAPWLRSCAFGMAAPFFAADVAMALGWRSAYWLQGSVALGGLVAGGWQARILRARVRGAGWWVVASVLGWTLAGITATLADPLVRLRGMRGIWGALAYLGIVSGAGLVLGVVTGLGLVYLLRATRPE